MAETYYCEKCNRTMNADQFYSSNDLTKYPNEGKFKQCKKCISMHVDNWNPDTYLWILQEADVPYVPDEWNKLMEKYARDKSKVTGMTILGRYLSKMKLKQFKEYRWKDTAFLQELANSRLEQAMKRQGYDAQEITMAIDKASVVIPEGELTQPEYATFEAPRPQEDYFDRGYEDEGVDDDLTDEDRIYLRLKWGKTYKPEEWVRLEQLYEEMMASYDIQGAGHVDTLKLLCKTSLKANQLIDIGDVEGFQKMSRVYDSLMKSGNFTAHQNKSENGEFIDSIAELVELCEKEGYIERFYIDDPNDKVDITIRDMQKYTKDLVEKETNLSAMIEQAIKNNAREDENDEEDDDEIIFDDDVIGELADSDFEDFQNFLESEIEEEDEE